MNQPPFFFMNPKAHFMTPGAIGFIPPWVFLFLIILTFSILFPKLFRHSKTKSETLVNPYLLAFIIGSMMPIFDDISAFILGPPFAHHSLFHSLLGSVVTYLLFLGISNSRIAKYAFLGNLTHTFFNFYFDYVTLFFPISYQEFGLTDIFKIDTYWIKAFHYPIILILFLSTMLRFFLHQKKNRIDS